MKRAIYGFVVLAGLAVTPALALAQDAGTSPPAQDDEIQPGPHDTSTEGADQTGAEEPTGEHDGGEDLTGDQSPAEASGEEPGGSAADEVAREEGAEEVPSADQAADGSEPPGPQAPGPEPSEAGPTALDTPAGSAAPDDTRSPREASDLVSVLSELFLERTERAEAAARRAAREARRADEQLRERDAQPAVNAEPIAEANAPVRVVDSGGGIGGWSLPDPRIKTAGLVFLILLALLGVWVLQRLRKPLPDRGLLPRLLGFTRLALRVLVVLMGIMIVSRLLPEWLRPALLLAMGAVALAVGAGTVFVLLPDVVGGLLLVTEGRIKAGLWIEGEDFRGTVLHIGPRLTILRIPDGTKLSIPNRRLVRSPIHAVSRRWHEVETELDVRVADDAAQVRSAIIECVICSPFVPVQPELEVTRDPKRPTLWRVHTRLLSAGYEAAFSGQLLERVEDALRGLEPPSDGSQAQVAEGRPQ
ncbi:MAG TPA: mechanosensitive ion channel [Polyangiaceae bacterium]|nr:mechanosensitive ion channel [Polyangiaceae bacterium]